MSKYLSNHRLPLLPKGWYRITDGKVYKFNDRLLLRKDLIDHNFKYYIRVERYNIKNYSDFTSWGGTWKKLTRKEFKRELIKYNSKIVQYILIALLNFIIT